MSIRICFDMFVDHLRKSNKEMPPYEDLTLREMKDALNVMYMQYILANSFTVSNNSVTVIAYHHLLGMINEAASTDSIGSTPPKEEPEMTKKGGWIFGRY